MHKLIIYDIEDDKTRNMVSKLFEKVGMVRVQKSVFVGWGSLVYWSKVNELLKSKIEKLLKGNDTICVLNVDEVALKSCILFGNADLFSTFELLKKEYLIV